MSSAGIRNQSRGRHCTGLCSGLDPFLLRSDNGLVFARRHYSRLVRSYGLKQEFITPHCPQQNGIIEPVIRTLKEQCVHRHQFEIQQHAMRVIADWIQFYTCPLKPML